MGLSDHETHVLQALEDDLAAGDPRLARALGAAGKRRLPLRLAMLGTATMGLGIGLMIYALALRSVPLGAAAFAAMTTGAFFAAPPNIRFRVWSAHRRSLPESRRPEER